MLRAPLDHRLPACPGRSRSVERCDRWRRRPASQDRYRGPWVRCRQFVVESRRRCARGIWEGDCPRPPPAPAATAPLRRFTAEVIDESVQLGVDPLVDVAAALRELGQHVEVDTGDLGDAVHRWLPGDSESAGELGSQPGVIQPRQAPLVHLQRACVQCQPSSVGGADPVGDHRMGVQLGIEFAAGVLTEHPHDDPFGVDTHHMTPLPHPSVRLRLHPGEHRVHRRSCASVTCLTGLVVADGEQHRHRLRCREGGVEASHRLIAVTASQPSTRGRMLSGHHRQKRLVIHLPVQDRGGRRLVRTSGPAARHRRGSRRGAARCNSGPPPTPFSVVTRTVTMPPPPCHRRCALVCLSWLDDVAAGWRVWS